MCYARFAWPDTGRGGAQQETVRVGTAQDQMRHPMHKRLSLARARAGRDQQGRRRFEIVSSAGSPLEAQLPHARWYGGTIKSDYLTDRLGANLDGMLAECAVLKEEALVHVPSHLSFEEAATLPCAAVTARVAVTRDRRVTAGDTVLTRAPEAYRCLPCNSPGSWATAALARRPYVPLRPLALRNGDFCRRSDLW